MLVVIPLMILVVQVRLALFLAENFAVVGSVLLVLILLFHLFWVEIVVDFVILKVLTVFLVVDFFGLVQ